MPGRLADKVAIITGGAGGIGAATGLLFCEEGARVALVDSDADAMRDTLTGDDEYGSGTSLASITADVSAVRELLGLLAPVLDPLAPHLVTRANGQLNAVVAAIGQANTDGASVAITDLPTLARERVDAAVGATLETLAPIPNLLTSTGDVAPLT